MGRFVSRRVESPRSNRLKALDFDTVMPAMASSSRKDEDRRAFQKYLASTVNHAGDSAAQGRDCQLRAAAPKVDVNGVRW